MTDEASAEDGLHVGHRTPLPTPGPASGQARRRRRQPRWSEVTPGTAGAAAAGGARAAPAVAVRWALAAEYHRKRNGLLELVAGLLDASPLPRFKLIEVQLERTGRAIQAAYRR